MINAPKNNHFNCSTHNPKINNLIQEGWYLYDGMKSNGRLAKKEWNYLIKQNPLTFFYKRESQEESEIILSAN